MTAATGTSNAKPNANWLDYATTARARSKIKSALNADTKDIAEEGKEILRRKLKQLKITLNESSVNDMVTYFKLKQLKYWHALCRYDFKYTHYEMNNTTSQQ